MLFRDDFFFPPQQPSTLNKNAIWLLKKLFEEREFYSNKHYQSVHEVQGLKYVSQQLLVVEDTPDLLVFDLPLVLPHHLPLALSLPHLLLSLLLVPLLLSRPDLLGASFSRSKSNRGSL